MVSVPWGLTHFTESNFHSRRHLEQYLLIFVTTCQGATLKEHAFPPSHHTTGSESTGRTPPKLTSQEDIHTRRPSALKWDAPLCTQRKCMECLHLRSRRNIFLS